MADVHNSETRRFNMSQIKSKDTKPELMIRKFLFSKGLRYRLHNKKLPGKPDIVFKKYRTVLFVNGCFWHGHENCRYFVLPKTRTEWWKEKIYGNKARDLKNKEELYNLGWRVLEVFECELKGDNKSKNLNHLAQTIKAYHNNYSSHRESKNHLRLS